MRHPARAAGALSAPLALLWCGVSQAELGLNMPQGVTQVSRDVYDLHMLILWICVLIGIVVFGMTAGSGNGATFEIMWPEKAT